MKLTAAFAKNTSNPGLYGDGNNLYLRVTKSGTKSWIFRWRDRNTNKLRDLGLGSYITVSLKEAREKAREARKLLDNGLDPKQERDRERAERRALAATMLTFDQCAEHYIKAHAPSWRNKKHVSQWRNTLATYASPVIGGLPVADVSQAHVMTILKPIWEDKTETATRVRQRIENILDWATASGFRTAANPAKWKGHLDQLLAKPTKVKTVRHHRALPYSEIYTFMSELRKVKNTTSRCLEFTILTAARTSEAINARWDEFDLDAGIWTVPASRIKAGREHRVPLSSAALKVLKSQKGQDSTYVFPGTRKGKPLNNIAMLKYVQKSGKDVTVHGFRSTFRDWAAECSSHPREVAEMALAHRIGDATEQAYQRGDLLVKRKNLMNAWAKHCAMKPITGNVVSISKKSA